MFAATLPILVNIFVAGMFVASFLTIAQLNPGFANIRWIALSYAFGLLTPLAELLLPLSPWPAPFMIVSYGGMLIGLVLMAPALSLLYSRQPYWGWAFGIIASGIALRVLIWGGQRNEFWYELLYQLPYAAAAFLCAATILRHGRKTGLDTAAASLFAVIGVHFLLKPPAAVYFGSGASALDYSKTTYALISQASSGVLLIGAGLLVLVNALQMVVLRDRNDAMSDPLTGLLNRRGLHAAFQKLTAQRSGLSATIAILDIDHFKAINDAFGHAIGDEVLRSVAECLEGNRPANATIARIGGEEFVLLTPWQEESLARLACESLRMAVRQLSLRKVDSVAVSIGFTPVAPGEDLSQALARADRALYAAKASGRDRCVFEPLDGSLQSGRATLRLVQ
ncbi:GGDEF domain-containing protein [Devosia sp. 63-57]|uniref:GGDEF domain-containing protein n=1 Tax=Devosia sp. 63-57 TaxID=1895751 RepID=UPI00086D15D6|nr:GGDEF domain-containing protein [Devosia sp. 63-57]ODT47096.1 MAG: hypothetical protein ABS74_12335 [Pelagibacterium sp. SCN 63-126]ODU88912.1 MAG: hypothetical protein ABT14_01210 [Pelagibacterium sp. SCN 63-17]OJX43193.1 MAG: hypothetical protein BGO80_17535 [Devosia sp. 63-57]